MHLNLISGEILKSAFSVHSELGPGLLESIYEAYLAYELMQNGLKVEVQKSLPVVYKGVKLDCGYRMDLLIENQVIVELKIVEYFNNVHLAQVLTYMKLADKKLGLLLNFNVAGLKDGIKRVVR